METSATRHAGFASRFCFAWALALSGSPANANEETAMIYPETERGDVVDEKFGTAIADPYRWLESDARRSADVARWIEAQNDLSAPYLAGLPGRDIFRQRLTALFDHERLTAPEKRGERYFFTRNAGLDNQSVLFVREGVGGADRVVLDPNDWSTDAATALAEWAPSEDGSHLAFAVQDGGSDWRTIRVMNIESGVILEDEIRWARFTRIAWAKNGSGFFYSRNPRPEKEAGFEAKVAEHAVYFHRLGTPQSEDRLVHAPASDIPLIHTVNVTPDGRYAVIYSTALTGGNALVVVDLLDPDWPMRTVVPAFDQGWTLAGNIGTKLFLSTQDGAPRGKIVTLDLAAATRAVVEIVAERPDATLFEAALIGDRLLTSYLVDAKTEVLLRQLDGTADGTLDLPGIGTAGGFRGRPGDDEGFFVFTSLDAPTTVYRFDAAANTRTVWAAPTVDLDQVIVEQRFYASKDGTRVPIFVVRRRDVAGPAPTVLSGYGGYGIPMVPYYSPEVMAWVEQGGVYAVANIRGGGEYGKAWHDAGRLQRKQNVFDDFIAAAEFLKAEGITSPDGLAIQGGSNGGLLVGAVVNQRPDLFAAAMPNVGVLDMLRFDRFTSGQHWVQEYGDPAVEADFRNLLSYSPYHQIRSGLTYPAILATTADTDDRVVPAHSFKYVAALQSADLGPRPRLLRVDTRAGHGAGKPTDKMIEEMADVWAFAARWTGLEVRLPK
ncbi:prolyl oligopeptidase family serine peptidase [Aureimonas glaciei]|uniref:prolyl oligopeptidase n=1 Tax=Aureimonas glaciei TaxID=1776957 RepID=A0A916Y8A0_9HYPH|nr:prolyl oligopeptidase family serine peptidase [Aureimonas glaciei]GGD33966.1 prolyl endopeptidase [Aureimonas glaciei]